MILIDSNIFNTFEKTNNMRTIKLKIPDTVDLNDREAKMLLASRLYEKGKLSLGQAAELVGLSKTTFMELLGDYDVSIFNYPPSELNNDIKNARDYSI
jgi:predicted HTH domain antitoxin